MFPIMMIVGPLSNFMRTSISHRNLLSARTCMFIGGFMPILGIYLSSYVTNFHLFLAIFSLCFGFTGFIYSIVLHTGWLYFQGNEGVVSGIIIAGFGIGGFITTELSTEWVNPNGVKSQEFDKKIASDKPFPPEVANNVPDMIRKEAIFMMGCFILGFILY